MTNKRRPVIVMLFFTAIICIVTSLPASMNMPIVDPGLFVISGVTTCGNSSGYCLLGIDCTMDDDFLPDPSGHCDGLKRAFTPSAPFSCCKFNNRFQSDKTNLTFVDENITTTKTENAIVRNKRENIESSKMDSDQLAKLSQIESVIKKIVEQLINETANNIKTDETMTDNRSGMEITTMKNELEEDTPMTHDSFEAKETTADPSLKTEETLYDEVFKAEAAESKGEIDSNNKTDTLELNTEEPTAYDEFKSENNFCQKTCKSEIIFMVEKKPMCYGTLLDDVWILTSATCASRLHKADIRKVAVSRRDSMGVALSISNIMVHENFKSPVSKNTIDNNDLALVSLTFPLKDPSCVPCFVQKRNITNETCRTFQNTNSKNTVKSAENCEGRLQQRNFVTNSYLVLPCNRWRMQHNQKEGRLGSGLWCDGKLAGVQTGVGVGSLIYTPVNEYTEWISDNKRIENRK